MTDLRAEDFDHHDLPTASEAWTRPAPVEHSPHCCSSRGCHNTCSHACGTDLEAIGLCTDPGHDYCAARQHIAHEQIEDNRRRTLAWFDGQVKEIVPHG